jgi:predicted nucleic-acid-binding protein
VVFAECVYVLESFYEAPRDQVAAAMRSLLAMPSVMTIDAVALLRALELYEDQRLHFAEAHLVAQAEATDARRVLSFDRALARATSIDWHQP